MPWQVFDTICICLQVLDPFPPKKCRRLKWMFLNQPHHLRPQITKSMFFVVFISVHVWMASRQGRRVGPVRRQSYLDFITSKAAAALAAAPQFVMVVLPSLNFWQFSAAPLNCTHATQHMCFSLTSDISKCPRTLYTLESGINVHPWINVAPWKFWQKE